MCLADKIMFLTGNCKVRNGTVEDRQLWLYPQLQGTERATWQTGTRRLRTETVPECNGTEFPERTQYFLQWLGPERNGTSPSLTNCPHKYDNVASGLSWTPTGLLPMAPGTEWNGTGWNGSVYGTPGSGPGWNGCGPGTVGPDRVPQNWLVEWHGTGWNGNSLSNELNSS